MEQKSNQISSEIQEFYKGKSVFVTGGTGFVGKVLVEKLLRSCPDIGNIYLLARGKKGKNIQERIDELVSVPLFDILRESNPNAFKKIIAIEGDIEKENFGISEADLEILYENVGVVFHSAATIKLNEPLRVAAQINMIAVKELIKICHKMKNLKAMIHVSTAFTNCDRMEAKEVIYPRKYEPDDILNLLKTHSDEDIAKMTPSIIEGLPNTYTFTKNMAERVTAKAFDEKLPVAIVRPSIVTSTYSDPFPGWIDNYGGAVLLMLTTGQGLAKTVLAVPSKRAETIPVDMTINMCIAAAWDVAVRKPTTMPIYNCTSGQINSMNIHQFWVEYTTKFCIKYPLKNAVAYPSLRLHENEFLFSTHFFFIHTIPAHLIDLYSRLTGKKPKLVKLYKFIKESCDTTVKIGSWLPYSFVSENPQKLMKTMSTNDQEIFPFDVRKINYKKHLEDYVLGVRKHLLKQDQSPEALMAARRNMERLRVRDQRIKATLLGVLAFSLGSTLYYGIKKQKCNKSS